MEQLKKKQYGYFIDHYLMQINHNNESAWSKCVHFFSKFSSMMLGFVIKLSEVWTILYIYIYELENKIDEVFGLIKHPE